MNVIPLELRRNDVPVPGIAVSAALEVWKSWSLAIPPTGSTNDREADQRLADLFRQLLALDGDEARLRLIETHVFGNPCDCPPADPFRDSVMRWWLDIYDAMMDPGALTDWSLS